MKNRTNKRFLLLICIVVIICFCVYAVTTHSEQPQPTIATHTPNATLSVMVIDVGQGDSILVTFGADQTMLIDAGEKNDEDAIFEELDERGITDIDILVATHPHADHIGSITAVIENYDVGEIYMPDKTSDSKTYQTLIDTINAYHIPVIEAYAGMSFDLGQAVCTIVSPDKNADEDANNESVAIFLDYNQTEFLFTGDIEQEAEEAILSSSYVIDADVLKVAHHGSSTGTTEDFLYAVSPEYAVISCGENNKYGHPHEETMNLLEAYDLDLMRTDICGDVLFLSDGINIEVITGD